MRDLSDLEQKRKGRRGVAIHMNAVVARKSRHNWDSKLLHLKATEIGIV